MNKWRFLLTISASVLVVSMCVRLAFAVPATNELPYGVVYGDVDLTEWAVEEVVCYDSFTLIRGHVTAEDIHAAGGTYQPLLDRTIIHLRSGAIDTGQSPPAVPVDLRHANDNFHLVQLIGPVKAEWVDELELYGDIVDYIPSFTFVMNLDRSFKALLMQLDFVRWVGPYLPAYRISPEVLTGQVDEVTVQFYDKVDTDGLTDSGLTIVRKMDNAVTVTGDAPAFRLAAQLPGVAFVQPHAQPQFFNNQTRQVIHSYHGHNNDVTAEGQIGAVTDTGVHWEHEAFNQAGKLLAYIDYVGDAWEPGAGGDGFGHGTHCAGSMLGDAPPYNQYSNYDGQGLGAQLIVVKIGTNAGGWGLNTDYYTMWKTPHCLGARVNTNSWGMYTWGGYLASSQSADQICWDYRDYVLTVAVGNGGSSGPGFLGAPGTAKNVITVGASERIDPENVALFSSRGPTADARIKPDVMAPGVDIISAQTGTADGYWALSGTSMSTPQVAGAALLVRDYFMRGFYPTGTARVDHEFEPSAALVKAILINGAEEMTGLRSDWNNEGVWPNNAQGWGRINLHRSLYFRSDDRQIRIWDNPVELFTGHRWTANYYVPPCARDVKFTLVWTDYPGAIGGGVALRNDLHLRVISPDGTVYLGNNFQGINPGFSVPGGLPDDRNTVEGVHLLRDFTGLVSGLWRVQVSGANVPDGPQNFALVASQKLEPCLPELQPIAVIGDYKQHLTQYLTVRGFSVFAYDAGDYRDVMADLDSISVIIINKAVNNDDFDILIEEAGVRNKGIIFLSQEPNADYGLGVLSDRLSDPASVSDEQGVTDLSVTVTQSHPIMGNYQPGEFVQLMIGGPGYFQTFYYYSGDVLACYSLPATGVIAVADFSSTNSGRHVLLTSLGVSQYGGTQYWTSAAEAILIYAIDWARNQL